MDDTPADPAAPLVTLMSSNGAGMGHLTRLLAYGRRLPHGVRRHVLSMSQAVPLVADLGLGWEYLPSREGSGLGAAAWRGLFVDRLAEYVERRSPDVVVFDGTHPYAGIDTVRTMYPATRWAWSRRGMWKPRLNADQIAKATWFDLVLEPGDLAHPADRGETGRAESVRVGPVTLLDPGELQERGEARRALGLPASSRLALVSLGAGNINDTRGDLGIIAAELHALGIEVVVTSPAIAERSVDLTGVHVVQDFPLSRRLRAFDLAVCAAGYNSVHEQLRFGVPTLFVANRTTSLDDQGARAGHAARQGWALAVDEGVRAEQVRSLLRRLLDDGETMAARAQAADPGNGAADAARHIGELAGRSR